MMRKLAVNSICDVAHVVGCGSSSTTKVTDAGKKMRLPRLPTLARPPM